MAEIFGKVSDNVLSVKATFAPNTIIPLEEKEIHLSKEQLDEALKQANHRLENLDTQYNEAKARLTLERDILAKWVGEAEKQGIVTKASLEPIVG